MLVSNKPKRPGEAKKPPGEEVMITVRHGLSSSRNLVLHWLCVTKARLDSSRNNQFSWTSWTSSAAILETDTNILVTFSPGDFWDILISKQTFKERILPKTMKWSSFKPLLSGHYILNPLACLLYVILKTFQPFCGWLFPDEECQISWVSSKLILPPKFSSSSHGKA